MLQLNLIREKRDYVIERLGVKHFKNAEQVIDEIIASDNKRRNTTVAVRFSRRRHHRRVEIRHGEGGCRLFEQAKGAWH